MPSAKTRPLRICMISGEYPPDEGGVADYSACLVEALAAEGLNVDVLTTRRPGRAPMPVDHAARRSEAGAAEPQPAPGAAAPGRVSVYRSVRHWHRGALRGLDRLIDLTGPDLVHLQYQAAAYGMHLSIHGLTWWLGHRRSIPSAVTYHDLRVPYLFPKAGRMRPWALRQLARHADLALTTNEADRAELERSVVGPRQALVPIGSNIADAPPAGYDRARFRGTAGYAEDSLVLAYFGFLNDSKGGLTLLEALDQLRTAGRDARLVMIGGAVGASDPTNARYLAGFEAEAARRGLEDRLRWTGHLPAEGVSAWLHAADLVCLPYADGASYRRGSLLAALAHGRPVVTTLPAPAGEGGLPALVDGRAARLVAPGDGPALAAAVGQIADDPDLAARLGEGAREVAAAFGWQQIARRHVELYREILATNAPSG